jgi:hypothetical protein
MEPCIYTDGWCPCGLRLVSVQTDCIRASTSMRMHSPSTWGATHPRGQNSTNTRVLADGCVRPCGHNPFAQTHSPSARTQSICTVATCPRKWILASARMGLRFRVDTFSIRANATHPNRRILASTRTPHVCVEGLFRPCGRGDLPVR